jgi:hypothetical protein
MRSSAPQGCARPRTSVELSDRSLSKTSAWPPASRRIAALDQPGINMNASSSTSEPLVVHVFAVKVSPRLSRTQRYRYFRRMQHYLDRHGVLMNFTDGLCFAISAHATKPRAHRHLFVNWLIDQPHTLDIVILPPVSLLRMLDTEFNLEADVVRLKLANEAISRWLVSRLLSGLMARAILRRQTSAEA